MDLVAIGGFHGRGRRAGWYGALLMAAYDPETQTWPSVCKLGTGFDDVTLESLKGRFKRHVSEAKPKAVDSGMEPDVWFDPAVVMEVQAAELTLSPTHRAGWGSIRPGAGLAARFPRFTGRWRDDKSAKQATTVKELIAMQAKPKRQA
jgi:DNA ligase 1